MKILVLANLYPPHQAGAEDLRCQYIVGNLKTRGHEVMVLTSTLGVASELTDFDAARRLTLNGAYGVPLVNTLGGMKAIETRNHAVLKETLAEFKPDVIHVFSLRGLSKSLVFALQQCRLPVVYDVSDTWIAEDIRKDPWLRWWNHPQGDLFRRIQEWTGQRAKLDAVAPTRPHPACDRMPELYQNGDPLATPAPNSLSAFTFGALYFSSTALKETTAAAGFKVGHGEVITPGIVTQNYVGQVKPVDAPMQKLLFVGRLNRSCGLLTVVRALQILRTNQVKLTLSVYGKGDSAYVAEVRSQISLQRLTVDFLAVSSLHRELPGLLRQHDALIYAAEEPEPFSFLPLQAMACGLPVVGVAIGGTRDVFRHGENALTFPAGNANELAARIQELCAQPELRKRIAETGQADVCSRHSDTVMVDRIESSLEAARQSGQAG